jgi:hypothetical protein
LSEPAHDKQLDWPLLSPPAAPALLTLTADAPRAIAAAPAAVQLSALPPLPATSAVVGSSGGAADLAVAARWLLLPGVLAT